MLDGRDMGTVICPDADVKLFVTASDAVRARRRHAELNAAGSGLTLEQVFEATGENLARAAERWLAEHDLGALAPLVPGYVTMLFIAFLVSAAIAVRSSTTG